MYALGECLLHFSVSSASVISGCESRNEKWQRPVDVCAADSALRLFFVSHFGAQVAENWIVRHQK
jgi:hypothetical protein